MTEFDFREHRLKQLLEEWRNVNTEVVFSWEDGDKRVMRFAFPNGVYFRIEKDFVYSNKKVFSMTTQGILMAINATVEYLLDAEDGRSA